MKGCTARERISAVQCARTTSDCRSYGLVCFTLGRILTLLLLAGGAGAVVAVPVIVEQVESPFGRLFVVDHAGLRHLRWGSFDGPDQSVIRLDEPARLVMPYLRPVALAIASGPSPGRVMMIGLGGGGFIHYLRRHFPRTRIDAVEIDRAVVLLARTHFGVEPSDGLNVHVADGAEFVEKPATIGRYDFVLLDAYSGEEIPAALATPGFLAHVRESLRHEGRVVANVGNVKRDAFVRTFEAIFPEGCQQLRAWQDDNVILIGGLTPLPDSASLARTARSLDATRSHDFRFETIARSLRPCATDAHGGRSKQ